MSKLFRFMIFQTKKHPVRFFALASNLWGVSSIVFPISSSCKYEKALQEVAKAIENNDTVASVKVVITLKKQKSCKANKDDE